MIVPTKWVLRNLPDFSTIGTNWDAFFELPLLVELSKIIPKDTWVKKIRFKKKNIEINGISKNASQLVPIVEKSEKFRDTHFVGTIITESVGEKFTINTAVGIK